MARVCRGGCGRSPTSPRHHYCDECRQARKRHRDRDRERTRTRLTPAQRGYGSGHKQLRQRWAREVATGGVECGRCGEPILPGEPWDLGHDDNDRSKYTGPEHRRCNRATSGRLKVYRTSRVW